MLILHCAIMFNIMYVDNNTVNHVIHVIGEGNWLNANAYVSVISRLVVHSTSILLALTIHLLSAGHYLAPAIGSPKAMSCVIMSVIMHVNDP